MKLRNFFEALASLRFTVVLMALAMVLIFAGTLAQVNAGVWQVVDGYFRSLIAWIDVQLFIPRQLAEVPLSIPFPGGLMLGVLLFVNLLSAHALRFRLVAKRLGIVVLHAGLIVLLAGEFVTGLLADEGMMSIDEGQSAQYVEDVREVELAVIDPSDPEVDRVVAIPQSLLARDGATVSHEALPVTVVVERWMANAQLVRAMGRVQATHGVGLDAMPEELPRARGVDGAQTDTPAAYVTLRRGSEAIGTWLLFAGLLDAQTVEIDGKSYGIALRYRRTYKPYTIHLIDFRHDKFVGTEVARNFSSQIRLIDPTRGTDREVIISMNNPLRYAGDTFYQASYKPGGTGTVLQVVRNPGAVLPYIACLLVGGGMFVHFLLSLTAFLRRKGRTAPEATEAQAPLPATSSGRQWVLPVAASLIALLIAFSHLFSRAPRTEFDLERFGALPVSAQGRVKPMDTAARHLLKVAGGRESVRHDGGRTSAVEFALRLMAQPESIKDLPVVRVDHPDVLALLNRTLEQGGRISMAAIEPHWSAINMQAMHASQVPPKQRDLFERSVLEVHARVTALLECSSMMAPYVVPPFAANEEWRPFTEAFAEARASGAASLQDLPPGVAYYVAMMTAFSENDAASFNKAVASYEELLEREMPQAMRKARAEVLFNRASLFLGTLMVYVLAFLLLCASMLFRMRSGSDGVGMSGLSENLRIAAVAMLWTAFAVHTLALVARIWLQERPPVTNLYSSAIMVGWASVLTALLLERIYRIGVAALGAATVGFATLIVAHNLGSDGDTMQMMQAVLDSNFWLATHVVTVTLGYSATFLAGVLGIFYIMFGVFTKYLTRERAQALARMVYGVVCFALLLSFVGTVLGGIWADQSWGRFWGWDPKENGAALVVLIAAIILHARWGGLIGPRGMMVLAVAGNIVTAWSWFGTNMLGVGLHSYGFMESAVFWLMAFVVSQLAVMAVGLLPPAVWRSQAHFSQPAN